MENDKNLEKRLKKLEARVFFLSKLLESMREGLLILDTEGRIKGMNRAFYGLTGYRIEEVFNKDIAELDLKWEGMPTFREVLDIVEEEGVWRGEVWGIHKNGSAFTSDTSVIKVSQDPENTYIVLFLDTTDRRSLEASLTSLAYYDPVTELPNRSLLHDHLSGAVSRMRTTGKMLAVLFLDIDNFKLINDTLGHHIGDKLLKAFSMRMASFFHSATMVSRFGGDEFVVVIEDLEDVMRVENLVRSFLESISIPFEVDGRSIYVTVSVGISLFPVDGSDPQTLLRNADIAMHHAKDMGKNSFKFFTEELNLKVNERFTLELRLREALGREEFVLYYQPQFDLATGKVTGVEALLRWIPRGGSPVLPGRFIHVAEETDLIIPIGDWVLRRACSDGKRLLDMGYPLRIAVNISAKQLSYVDLVSLVEEVIGETGFDPSFLDLEITESALMRNKDRARSLLVALKNMGVSISIDDFGTSYSSLNYLKYFPVDRLKIDRSFIGDIISDPNDVAIATTIIAIAHNLGLKAVAEGVETEDQLTFLRLWQCDEAQGFLFSPPVSFENLHKILKGEI
jgi:diguanylate cyclase (GGDEF)-like protein/PAS domain S-box-containing protein